MILVIWARLPRKHFSHVEHFRHSDWVIEFLEHVLPSWAIYMQMIK